MLIIKVDKSQIEGCTYLSEIIIPFISGKGLQDNEKEEEKKED